VLGSGLVLRLELVLSPSRELASMKLLRVAQLSMGGSVIVLARGLQLAMVS
jgi:hypothetical protein